MIALAKIVEEIKAHSSKWIKTKGEVYSSFYCQNGYGTFSVNLVEVEVVVNYIKNQKQHHERKGFENKYGASLKKYNVAYDERYVWD